MLSTIGFSQLLLASIGYRYVWSCPKYTHLRVLTSSQDILGLLMLLWPRARKEIVANSDASTWLLENANNSYRSFEDVGMFEEKDVRRLIMMDPAR